MAVLNLERRVDYTEGLSRTSCIYNPPNKVELDGIRQNVAYLADGRFLSPENLQRINDYKNSLNLIDDFSESVFSSVSIQLRPNLILETYFGERGVVTLAYGRRGFESDLFTEFPKAVLLVHFEPKSS